MIEIIHRITCNICGDVKQLEFDYYENMTMPIPFTPEGWRETDGITICPNHEVKKILFIDGKEVSR